MLELRPYYTKHSIAVNQAETVSHFNHVLLRTFW